MAHAAPDGYTLLMASSTQTVNETLYKDKPYRLLRDLVPIAPLIEDDLVLVVNPSVPVKNLAEFLALHAPSRGRSISARPVRVQTITWRRSF